MAHGPGRRETKFVAPPATVAVSRRPPTFSIVIAAYQAEAFLGDAIRSALDQTRPPEEVIVCDDGSTDGTASVIDQFGNQVRRVWQPNAGEGAAKNAAARLATSEYVVLLDADDLFLPRRLQALAELATARPDLDILTTDAVVSARSKEVGRYYETSAVFEVDDQRSAILDRNWIFSHAAVRREKWLEVGGFDEKLQMSGDWDCWIRMVLSGGRAGLVDEVLSVYRLHDANATADRARDFRGRASVLRKTTRHPTLSSEERARVIGRAREYERRAAVIEAETAVLGGHRRLARLAAVAFGRGHGALTRVKALAALVAPGPARRVMLRREGAGTTRARRQIPGA